ncbi:glutamine synthetase [Rhodopseudomonas julia]|uniref:Glutamine synthetase n=1 Tax=Rhodopseudomonas julia TaxID=200617 RepID=A0ABU0C7D5_9BRAD|nr:glutamine synthetase family protein [Rhodopseudomonas julia]MDQ0324997.1 glutamine synthetase [Rhodopseudomonas julia]
MGGRLTLEELRALAAAGEIDTVLSAQIDMQGRLMGKRFHVDFFLDNAWKESRSCSYLQATDLEMTTVEGYKSVNWVTGYGDYVMRPDLATLRRVPWLEATALVICDVLDPQTLEEVPHSPRALLKKQLKRLEAMGFRAMTASELEFFMFRESYEEAEAAAFQKLNTFSAYNGDYNIFQSSKEEDVMRAIRNGLAGTDVPVEATKGEADAGQGEINVRYSDALTMADRHAIIKNAVKEIAWQKGRAITFMAKWDTDHAGNSSHIHQSLTSLSGEPVFFDPDGEHGMSKTMRAYVAGLLAHSREITYFLAPYVNSYKRFTAGTFAPTRVLWSLDNRTAGYRLCGENGKAIRIECRIGGADLNPHLAFAALIAAGIDGIEKDMPLEEVFLGDAYSADDRADRDVPKTLREAIAALEGSSMLREAFGEEVIAHYLHCARWEQHEADRIVTDFDRRRGFERA